MIEAGVSVVAALVTLEEQTNDKYLREVIAEIRSDVEAGMVLSQAFARHPKVFNRLYVSMIEAGESSGTLDEVLDRAATQIEKETQLKRRVKGAMVYPAVVLTFASLVLTFMLLFIIPVFVDVYDDWTASCRRLTQVVMAMSNALRALVVHHLPGRSRRRSSRCGGLKRTEKGRQVLGSLQAPDPDEDRRRRAEGRAGAHVADAGDARRRRRRHHHRARDHGHDGRQLGDRAVDRQRARARARGRPDRRAAHRRPVFPPMLGQMVKIGEETGELEKMLSKVADFYEDEVDASIQSLTSIIEPILMIGVGAMVGTIVISMYLPMFKMLTLIK